MFKSFEASKQPGVALEDIYSETCEMGILDDVLGNATEAECTEVETLVVPILVRGERLTHAFVVGHEGKRGMFMLTEKRLVMIDKSGVLGVPGKKTKVSSYPWASISSWTYCNSGKVDFDAELIIRVRVGNPFSIKFPKNFDLQPLVKAIGENCLDFDEAASPAPSGIPNFIKKVRSNKD